MYRCSPATAAAWAYASPHATPATPVRAAGVGATEPAGAARAPVAADHEVALVAEHAGHQRVDRLGDVDDAEAPLAGREGEAVARQRRHHDPRGAAQLRDQVVELP